MNEPRSQRIMQRIVDEVRRTGSPTVQMADIMKELAHENEGRHGKLFQPALANKKAARILNKYLLNGRISFTYPGKDGECDVVIRSTGFRARFGRLRQGIGSRLSRHHV